PAIVPLRQQDESAMPHEPDEEGPQGPLEPPVGEHQEPHKQTQSGPGMAPEAQRPEGLNTLPHAAQDGYLIAVNRPALGIHGSVAPATSPSVPSIAVPPPRMRRLRGRSYPRSLASELYVRVSPHHSSSME